MVTSNAPFCTLVGPLRATVGRTSSLCVSSSLMVPVPVSMAVTLYVVPETLKLTVKVSSASLSVSSVVETVKVWVSSASPVKVSRGRVLGVVRARGGGAIGVAGRDGKAA